MIERLASIRSERQSVGILTDSDLRCYRTAGIAPLKISVPPPCSLCLCGEVLREGIHHGGAENTKVAQRKAERHSPGRGYNLRANDPK